MSRYHKHWVSAVVHKGCHRVVPGVFQFNLTSQLICVNPSDLGRVWCHVDFKACSGSS